MSEGSRFGGCPLILYSYVCEFVRSSDLFVFPPILDETYSCTDKGQRQSGVEYCDERVGQQAVYPCDYSDCDHEYHDNPSFGVEEGKRTMPPLFL